MNNYLIVDNIPLPSAGGVQELKGRKNRHKGLALETMAPGQSVCLEKLPKGTRSANSKIKLHTNSIKCLIRDRKIKLPLHWKVDFYVKKGTKEIRLWILNPLSQDLIRSLDSSSSVQQKMSFSS